MKRIKAISLLIGLLMALPLATSAQRLSFNKQGEFKILQFTDLHYQSQNPRSRAVLRCIEEMVDAEKPDLVIFTGDNIYSKPADEGFKNLMACIDQKKVPYVMLFGNHDEEQGMPHAEMYDLIRTGRYNIQPERGNSPSPDYVLEITGSNGASPAAILYCIDSHSYAKQKSIGGYAWITFDQIAWYRQKSTSYTQAAGGNPLPALAFFHIPLPEFATAAANEQSILIGTRMEQSCPPKLNSGLFTAMREQGDVMGIFCGHDHDNDYTLMHYDILLGYGRFSGGNTEYNHLPQGARVIVLKEGKRTFDTWIRERKGGVTNRTTYPTSYVKDNWKKRPITE